MIHEVAFDNVIICTIVSNKTSFCSEHRPWQNKLDNLEAIIKLDRLCLWLVTLQTFYCNGVSLVHCFRKRSIRVFLKINEKEANSMLKTKIKICIQQNVKPGDQVDVFRLAYKTTHNSAKYLMKVIYYHSLY